MKKEIKIKKKKKKIEEIIKIPEEIEVSIDKEIKIYGKKGEIKKKIFDRDIKIGKREKDIVISSEKNTKREKKKVGSFKAHIKNMIKGAIDGHSYKLKICASHFPMNVSVEGDKFIVKNFLGEKVPRVLKLKEKDLVKIEGDKILVEGVDKEIVAQTAASIEQLCKIKNKDKRIFQDGCYIISKDEKEIK